MTVGELIEMLSEVSPDMEIIIQKDSEGNNYSPLCDGYYGWYVPLCAWGGEVYADEINADNANAVVLYPIN